MAVTSISHLVVGAALLLATYVAYNVVWNLLLSPLARFPGPKLWAISNIPNSLSLCGGKSHIDALRLFNRYGPVVRNSPNSLIFLSENAYKDIYGRHLGKEPFPLDRDMYALPPTGTDHIVSTPDPVSHARQRKLLSSAFSERAINDQEPIITGYVDKLIERLHESCGSEAKGKGVVDLKSWLNFTTFDITGDLTFGESFGCLDDSALHPWVAIISSSFQMYTVMMSLRAWPWLFDFLQMLVPPSIKRKGLEMFQLCEERMEKRLNGGDSGRSDFVSLMLRDGLAEKGGGISAGEDTITRAEMRANSFILISGGSETSATCLSAAFYYLLKHPAALHKLQKEVRSAFRSDEEIAFATTAHLQYLNAVLQESLRVHPPAASALPRVAPASGGIVDGHAIPGGTKVGFHQYGAYRSPINFSEPDTFAPERWLEGPDGKDGKYASDRRGAHFPFSHGPKVCLGMSLAWAEMRLIMGKLVWNFDMELSSESANWSDQPQFILWDKPALMVKLTPRNGGS